MKTFSATTIGGVCVWERERERREREREREERGREREREKNIYKKHAKESI